MIRSSNDSAKLSSAPAATAGAMSGSVTWRNAAVRRRSQVARRLLHARVERDRAASPDDDRHVADGERDVGDRDLQDRPVGLEHEREEQQQADAHDDLRGDHGQQDQRVGRGRRPTACAGGPGPGPAASPGSSWQDGDQGDLEGDTLRPLHQVHSRNKLRVPAQREALPREDALGVVEAEEDQHHDRREQERRRPARRTASAGGSGRAPSADHLPAQEAQEDQGPGDRDRGSCRKPRAAPNGQSRLDMNSVWMTLAT